MRGIIGLIYLVGFSAAGKGKYNFLKGTVTVFTYLPLVLI